MVNDAPGICEDLKSFILPYHEGLSIHHGWLHDFLALEDAPGDCVDLSVINVLELETRFTNCLVANGWVLVQELAQVLDYSVVYEQLKVSLLVDVAVLRTPSVFVIS